jgi:hypothetical protein
MTTARSCVIRTGGRSSSLGRDHARECVVHTGRRSSSLGRQPDPLRQQPPQARCHQAEESALNLLKRAVPAAERCRPSLRARAHFGSFAERKTTIGRRHTTVFSRCPEANQRDVTAPKAPAF